MLAKKTTSFSLKPDTIRALKYISCDIGVPIGDVIEGLVKFTKSAKFVEDAKYRELFDAWLHTSLYNTGRRLERGEKKTRETAEYGG